MEFMEVKEAPLMALQVPLGFLGVASLELLTLTGLALM